ncbi:hypothetical protein PMAYCL1PPCAC_13157, partial [Pristionchus mayeri]
AEENHEASTSRSVSVFNEIDGKVQGTPLSVADRQQLEQSSDIAYSFPREGAVGRGNKRSSAGFDAGWR